MGSTLGMEIRILIPSGGLKSGWVVKTYPNVVGICKCVQIIGGSLTKLKSGPICIYIFEPTCVWLAHLHHFLSVCPSVTGPKFTGPKDTRPKFEICFNHFMGGGGFENAKYSNFLPTTKGVKILQ